MRNKTSKINAAFYTRFRGIPNHNFTYTNNVTMPIVTALSVTIYTIPYDTEVPTCC